MAVTHVTHFVERMLPSVPYPPAQDGYWSPVTATLNWCEEDYYATIYSAEIVNSLTNLMFLYLAYKGISNCLRNDHDTVFLVAFLGYSVVGLGSFLFHSTLTYPMQLIDELSMIYTTCLMFFASFSYGRALPYRIVLGVLLFALSLFITLYYHYLQDPTFHQNCYTTLTIIVLGRAIYVMETQLRPSSTPGIQNGGKKIDTRIGSRSPAERRRLDQRDGQILRHMWMMVAYGMTTFLTGFAIWSFDNIFCSNLRLWRHQVGLPWGILAEGHGWWHLLTGIGAYYYIVWGIWLRHCLNNDQDRYELIWPRTFTSFPEIVLRDKRKRFA